MSEREKAEKKGGYAHRGKGKERPLPPRKKKQELRFLRKKEKKNSRGGKIELEKCSLASDIFVALLSRADLADAEYISYFVA